MIFSVLLLLLLHKCAFACATVCVCVRVCARVHECMCVFERALAEPCINKAGHGSCTWPLMINRRSTTKRQNI